MKLKMAKKVEVPMKECSCCGELKKVNAENFYKSYSVLYQKSYDNRLHICKQCTLELAEKYEKKFGSQIQATYYLCRLLDMLYDEAIFETARNQAIKNQNNVYQIYFQKILSLKQNANKTFMDSEGAIPKGNFENNTVDGIDVEIIEFWGEGYTESEYNFLEREYMSMTTRYECDTYALETLFQEIAFLKLDIRRKRQQGLSVDKEIKTLQDLLGSANIKPTQENAAMANEQVTMGTLIKKFENERPIPNPLQEWLENDLIGKYIRTWFLGCLARMMGKKNPFQEEFDEEIAKYTVTPYDGSDE